MDKRLLFVINDAPNGNEHPCNVICHAMNLVKCKGVQVLVITIQPGQVAYLMVIAALAGIGISAAYVLPDALFADIIEWDGLRTHRCQEGIYFGMRAFIRKVTGALVIFITLQSLGWSGYQTLPEASLNLRSQPLLS